MNTQSGVDGLEKKQPMSLQQTELQKQLEFFAESSFHRSQLNRIKRALGSKCTYLSHETRPHYNEEGEKSEKYFLKAVLVNELGGKDTVTYEIDGTPKSLTETDYNTLFRKLNHTSYVEDAGRESKAGV